MSTITISIPDTMKQYVEEQVQSNGYGNVSEYFRSLIREAQRKQEDRRLEMLLLQGLESEAVPVTPEFWEELKAEASARLEEAKRRKGRV